MMQNWGWEPGKELGRNVTPTADMVETSEEFTAASHPHFFLAAAQTGGRRQEEVHHRIKRMRDGTCKPVLFTQGEVLEPVLTWKQLIDALIEMTEFGFSRSGLVHVLDTSSERYEQQQFGWQLNHFLLCKRQCLPFELKRGMEYADNGDLWESTMQSLLSYETYDWRLKNDYFLQYQLYISRLWKTLEFAMNHAEVDLAFCVFVCSKVMEACSVADCGYMFLNPVLEPITTSSSRQVQRFQAKFRYRAQGRDPKERYRQKATQIQLQRGELRRPFLAAKGIAPLV